MKNKILPAIFMILTATLLVAVMPTEADAEIYSDTIRLHILAASDGDEDQRLKLLVRDAVLREYSELLSRSEDTGEALEAARGLLSDIELLAEECLRQQGCDYGVTVTLGKEWYDTRDYGDFSLPRGIYSSLIIRIGEGEGRNWWCVMYPPMCLDIALEDAPSDDAVLDYSDAEISLISSGKYNLKFKLLELISDFIG